MKDSILFKPFFSALVLVFLFSSCSQVRYTYYKKVKGEKVVTGYEQTAYEPVNTVSPETEEKSPAASLFTENTPALKQAKKTNASKRKAEKETQPAVVSGFQKVNNATRPVAAPESISAPVRSDDTSFILTILLIILVVWLLGFLLWGNMIINLLLIVAFVLLILLIIRHFA